ncbi:MAG: hypothetical protein WDN69_27990 [Aliidongia sp.]
MAWAPNLPTLMIIAALAAINGPLCDLALLDLMQSNFPLHILAPVFRVQSAVAVGGILIAYLMTPALFQHFPVRDVIFGSGLISAISGCSAPAISPGAGPRRGACEHRRGGQSTRSAEAVTPSVATTDTPPA